MCRKLYIRCLPDSSCLLFGALEYAQENPTEALHMAIILGRESDYRFWLQHIESIALSDMHAEITIKDTGAETARAILKTIKRVDPSLIEQRIKERKNRRGNHP